jgi:hypothetical protein
MKNFDAKWQSCAALARQTPPRDESVPAGFTSRVVARAAASDLNPLTEVWQALVVRLLAGSVGLLLICAAIELPHLRETKPLEPGIENAVAQLVWSL